MIYSLIPSIKQKNTLPGDTESMQRKNPYYDASKAHHTPHGFRNLEPSERTYDGFKRWQEERKQQGFPKPPQQGYPEFIKQWWQPVDLRGDDDRIWWLGHASMLLRLEGRYTLIDPVLGKRASPLNFYGPQRKTPPPISVADLPTIDTVLLSHNHYDHMDRETLCQLIQRFPKIKFVVPLGLKAWLFQQRARYVEELDWWDSTIHQGVTYYCTPARHWSVRTPWDKNRSLWSGWVIHHPHLKFYFSGDSGYSDRLQEIGQRLGPLDIAALPIGAYSPRWFMQENHMDPQQSVLLHQQLGVKLSIAIHWGVFELADDALDEPPEELRRALSAADEDSSRFQPIKIGGHIVVKGER